MEVGWSEAKRQRNLLRHGVDFRDAAQIFLDPYRLAGYDHEHSDDEDRWWTIGTARGKVLFVIHLERAGERFRLISARKAKTDERRRYHDGLPG